MLERGAPCRSWGWKATWLRPEGCSVAPAEVIIVEESTGSTSRCAWGRSSTALSVAGS